MAEYRTAMSGGLLSPTSPVFLQRKNIGEVARSDGGVKKTTGKNKKELKILFLSPTRTTFANVKTGKAR